ncbi:hypothetical protein [Brytella acorum]|uniref:Uncharacterized protein n=1 Tax=Brytella acorum TaxID=2959299 RepID=A0AA35Y3R2_9PROT|nr:hypothetical protein [Brytella acorum]MDF3625023.1 hypothetical protein [Brytella acorum]CAI9121098.1 hypothetical protein LMG32879_001944 [Brytella acorum]
MKYVIFFVMVSKGRPGRTSIHSVSANSSFHIHTMPVGSIALNALRDRVIHRLNVEMAAFTPRGTRQYEIIRRDIHKAVRRRNTSRLWPKSNRSQRYPYWTAIPNRGGFLPVSGIIIRTASEILSVPINLFVRTRPPPPEEGKQNVTHNVVWTSGVDERAQSLGTVFSSGDHPYGRGDHFAAAALPSRNGVPRACIGTADINGELRTKTVFHVKHLREWASSLPYLS